MSVVLALAPAADARSRGALGLPPSQCSAPRPYVSMSAPKPSPHASSPISLQADSIGRGVTYAWDLDGDGAYDDAAGASASATLPAGTATVSVRATDEFGRSAAETRTLLVHAWNAQPVPLLSLGVGLEADDDLRRG
jgi:hypothetical protein